jgi:hypothetical protein
VSTPDTSVRSGRAIVRASWAGTAVFTVASLLGATRPRPFSGMSFAISVALFGAGCLVFLVAFARAVGRSRTEDITVASLFFLMGGSTPPAVQRGLLASLLVEIVAGVAAAAARPFTSQAAGVLAPMWALGLCGLWAARHGRFQPR